MSSFTPRFPEVLDSTMLSDFRACPRQFYYGYIRRLRGLPSIHLHAGGAYAAGLEAARTHYLLNKDAEAALLHGFAALAKSYGTTEPPPGYEYKGFEHLSRAFVKYFDRWPLAGDTFQLLNIHGKPGVEFSFALPLPINHPVTGNPLIYGGRIDWIGHFNGSLFLVDEKTTSYFGQEWASKWSLRAQFMAYCYAARQFGFPVLGAIVRGVALKLKEPDFCEAGPLLFPEWKLDRWYDQTIMDIHRMLQAWRAGHWDWTYGDACNAFGGCAFDDLCRTREDEAWITPDKYTENTWSPIQIKETVTL